MDLLSLSPRILDTLNVYVQPFFSLFTLVCSMLCAITLSSKRLEGITYQHLFIDSVAATVYGLSNCFTFIIRCGALCSLGYSYWSKLYEIYFYGYLGKSLELFMLLVEIHLSYLRIASFSKENKSRAYIPIKFRYVIFFIVAFSTCVTVTILPRSIILTGYLAPMSGLNNTILTNVTIDSSYTPLYIISVKDKYSTLGLILLVISILQGVGLLMVLVIINVVLFVKFRLFLRKKKISGSGKSPSVYVFKINKKLG